MDELTLNIDYKPLKKSTLWMLGSIWAAVGYLAISLYYAAGETINIWLKLIYIFGGAIVFSYPPVVVMSFYREGGKITANSNGLVFPPSLFGFGDTASLKWKDVLSIDVATDPDGNENLLFFTAGTTPSKIKMSSVPQDQIEQLLLAMEMWLPAEVWTERAIARRDGLQISSGEAGFTQLWEAELRRRYNATTFVPHDPGSKIGENYKVVKQLAFGGFSAVYQAENGDKEKVVIKELVVQNSDDATQQKAVELFQREASLLAKLDHPQIARVFDHFVLDCKTYIVMEHIDGENLRDLVRRKGAQAETLVRDLALQMASILDYLHGLNPPIIHRDFTPDNLVLSSHGKITLIDFGAANEFTSAATGTLIGKQSYMPLEQIRGKAEPRSDLYALGCVLHYLLTGKEAEPLTVCHPAQINPQVSREMDDLIAKLTAIEADMRLASSADVVAALSESTAAIPIREVETHGI